MDSTSFTEFMDELSTNYPSASSLMVASGLSYENIVQYLLDSDDVNIKDKNGKTALILTANALKENEKVLKMLLNRGADVNIADKMGKTALNYALDRRHYNIAQLLVESGAHANQQARNGELETVKWLWDRSVRATANGANEAASNGHLDVVQWLWDRGVRATIDGAEWAAANGKLDVAQWLWKQGVPKLQYRRYFY
jgi:ankyrin repeat protein